MSNTVSNTYPDERELSPPLGSLALARVGIDRGCDRRMASDMVENLWQDPETKVLPLIGRKTAVRNGQLVLYAAHQLERPAIAVYLGRTLEASAEPDGEPADTEVVLAVYDNVPAELSDADFQWLGLREVATELSARDTALFVEGLAVSNWHATHTHCPRCGAGTVIEAGGWVRRCSRDDSEHYPRTDPAIIVTVVDEEDRLLLGNSASWETNRFSTLAGFVEPGESLEAAVIREVAEESGVVVHSPRYLGSQPWPFPNSLMLGFTAMATDTATRADGVEIRKVRWFSRAELAAAAGSGEIQIASGASIARSLIEHWYGGPIPQPADPA